MTTVQPVDIHAEQSPAQTCAAARRAPICSRRVSWWRTVPSSAGPAAFHCQQAVEKTLNATEVRYPGESPEISLEDARQALAAAEAVWGFVLGLLPRDLQVSIPQGDSV